MADGVHIYIQKGKGASQQSGGQSNFKFASELGEEGQAFKEGYGTLKAIGGNQLVSMVMSSGKQIISYGLSQYGNNTGDYIGQTELNNALSNVSQLVGIGGAALSGFMFGGVVGAAASGGVALGSLLVQSGINYYNASKQAKRNYQESVFNSQLIGSILVDGNR